METEGNGDEPTAIRKEEQLPYWLAKTPAEREAETWRLSVEKYGEPKGSLRDGPFRMIRRTISGEFEGVEWTRQPATGTSCDGSAEEAPVWVCRTLRPDEITS
jgi:hypothetical protein